MSYVSLYRIYVLRERKRRPRRCRARASVTVVVPTRNEAGNVAAALRAHAGDGQRHRADLRRRAIRPTTPGQTIQRAIARYRRAAEAARVPADGQGQGRRRAPRLRARDRRHPDDPRRRPDGAARGSAARSTTRSRGGQGEFVNGVAARLPDGAGGDALLQPARQQRSSAWLFTWLLEQPIKDTLCGTKVLWRARLRAHRRQPRLLRRLRSVRRFRPAVRRRAAEPEDRRAADALPRAHLRRRPTSSAGGTACCCCACRPFAARKLKFV